MFQIEYTTQFKRDLKLAKRRRNNFALLQNIMEKIVKGESLDAKYKDHPLSGNWKGFVNYIYSQICC
jgi:mRNA interferase YafQ